MAKDIKKMTKVELEAEARKKGVELDRRKSKKDLLKQVTSLFDLKSEAIEEKAAAPAPKKKTTKAKPKAKLEWDTVAGFAGQNLAVFASEVVVKDGVPITYSEAEATKIAESNSAKTLYINNADSYIVYR